MQIQFGDTVLSDNSTTILNSNQDYTVNIEYTDDVSKFKGFLVRAEDEKYGGNMHASFTESSIFVQAKSDCPTGVGAMTHTGNTLKKSVEFTFRRSTQVPQFRLDVTVVNVGRGDPYNWLHSKYALAV